MEWIWVKYEQAFGNGFNEYISTDGHYCKQVWFDGYEEIFEIAQRKIGCLGRPRTLHPQGEMNVMKPKVKLKLKIRVCGGTFPYTLFKFASPERGERPMN